MTDSSYISRRRALRLTGMVGLAAVAACAPAPAPTGAPTTSPTPTTPTGTSAAAATTPAVQPTTTAASQGADREAQLIEGARSEGRVVYWSAGSVDAFEYAFQKFQEKYPFLEVDYRSAPAASTTTQVLAEGAAGQHTWDVIASDWGYIPSLKEADLLKTSDFPTMGSWPAGRVDPAGYWVASHMAVVLIGYNTELLSPETAPKGYEDLLDPKWSGKVAVDAAGGDDLVLMLWEAWGKEKTFEYIEALAKNNPIRGGGTADRLAQLAAGAYPLAIRMSAQNLLELKEEGAPLDFVREGPLLGKPSPIVMAKNAPHPNAQQLFVDWYVSPEGQQIISDSRVWAMLPDPNVKGKITDAIGDQEVVIASEEVLANAEEAADLWERLFAS